MNEKITTVEETPTLFIVRGIPASGKSTFALNWVQENITRYRVSRDDLRAMTKGKFLLSGEEENHITKMEHGLVDTMLSRGRSVVVDAMNLRAAFVKPLLQIAAKYGAVVEHKDFYVDLDVALARNAARDRKVPDEVIVTQFQKFCRKGELVEFPVLAPTEVFEDNKYVADESKPNVIILDVDGTAMNVSPERSPYEYNKVHLDTPNEPVIAAVKAFQAQGYLTVVMSGREDACYEATYLQLVEAGVDVHALHMRATGDQRRDSIVKREMFDAHIRDNFNVLLCLDDRDQVVDMYRKDLGLPVFQVNYGAF